MTASILPLPPHSCPFPAAWDVFFFIAIVTMCKYLRLAGFSSDFESLEEAGKSIVYVTAFCLESHDLQ